MATITPIAMRPTMGAAGIDETARIVTPRILPTPDDDRAHFDPGRLHRARLGGLPAWRVDRAGVLPRHAPRQAVPRRGPGRRRQDRAGQGAEPLSRPHARAAAVLRGPRRGQGALRVELPQATAAHPGRGPRGGLAGR